MNEEQHKELFDLVGDLEGEVATMYLTLQEIISARSKLLHPEVTPVAYRIAMMVDTVGKVRASEIVSAFDLDKGAVSRKVAQLIDLGLVQGEKDPSDGRALLLSVTDRGKQRIEEVSRIRREQFINSMGDWESDDIRSFITLINRYNSVLAGGLANVTNGQNESPEG